MLPGQHRQPGAREKIRTSVRYADVPLSTTSTVTLGDQAVGVRFGLAALLRTPRQILGTPRETDGYPP